MHPSLRPDADGYRVEVFADTDDVTADDVLALWRAEDTLPPELAQTRVHEVHLVGLHGDELVAVSTRYLERNAQLGLDLWYYRAFTAAAHRAGNVAALIAFDGLAHLIDEFTSGRDRRGVGMVYEVENEGLKRYFPQAVWMPGAVTFIGSNARGDHVRVRYFPGATVPPP